MAWFNSGLNSIKGQLTNLAQEVLADANKEEEALSTIEALEQAHNQCEELSKICAERDTEIATLRKQIADLQSQASENSGNGGEKAAQLTTLKNASLEDSWFWEENTNTTTNSSESENEKHTPQGGRVKDLKKENKVLNEKILLLQNENKNLNTSIEELDAEHQLAVQNLLELKTELQVKYTAISKDYEVLKKEHAHQFMKGEREAEELQKKCNELEASQSQCLKDNAQLKSQVADLTEQLLEHKQLQELLIKKDKDIIELTNTIKDYSERENQNEEMILNAEKNLSESSSGKQSVDEDFIVVPDSENEARASATPSKEDLEEKINQLENQISDLIQQKDVWQAKCQEWEMEKSTSMAQLEETIERLEATLKKNDDETKELCKRNDLLVEEKRNVENDLNEVTVLAEVLKGENISLKDDICVMNEKLNKCEANAVDVESKLMMENVDLQKKFIDLESSINRSTANISSSSDLDVVKDFLSTYTHIDIGEPSTLNIESAFKQIRDKIWQIDVLEKNLSQMAEEISQLQEIKSSSEHDKKNLEADISQYIIQCDELMKNNEILLNELENYRRNKLETISENNEDNILLLESQLDECRSINTTLEEEYRDLNDKISELENEKQELLNQLRTVQDTNADITVSQNQLKQQVENLEQDKSNLLFEINEIKSGSQDDDEIHAELTQYKTQCKNLEIQIEQLNGDLSDAVIKLQTHIQSLSDVKKENEQLEQLIRQKDITLSKLDTRIQELLQQELPALESIKIDNEHLLQQINLLREDKVSYTEKIAKLESDLLATSELEKSIESLNFEKNEIIKTLQAKHSENMQYYMEIQRLGQLLQAAEQKNALMASKTCEQCEELKTKIENEAKETEKLRDQITFLKEKSDILTVNLLTEQKNQELLQQDKSELAESNANLRKDLDRLREHLVELEEAHTEETIEMQRSLDEANAKMNALQEDVSKSSNAYTSASIRANQHAETLQAQYALVTQQRDDLVAKLSLAEDRESKNQAALVNLQCALEQFQNDKENEIKLATQKLHRELESERSKQKKLENDIATLNQQLEDANQGLRAASRLSQKLESSQMDIARLKEEVDKLTEKNAALNDKLNQSETSQVDKIEKNLIKSLVIGYVVSSNINDKNQILRMITSVLDFTQLETDKVGLNKQNSNWLGSFLPPIPGPRTKDSLVQAFVNFLEQESQPRNKIEGMPNLLNITSQGTTSSSRRVSTATDVSRKSSITDPATKPGAGPVQPILLNTVVMDEFIPSRNSSSILKDILNDS